MQYPQGSRGYIRQTWKGKWTGWGVDFGFDYVKQSGPNTLTLVFLY